ncbi:MAG: N-acetyltransferase family protein [Holophagales bacterium]|nr:N-acetyltransferase family protein [Holophagales bacterium]
MSRTRSRLEPSLRPMRPEDWPQVRRIYEQGIATGDATFESHAPDWPAWASAHLEVCRWVAEERETGSAAEPILGWAALALVSSRSVYAGVAEVSLYVAGAARGRGVGRALLERLVSSSEEAGFWTLEAGIFPENRASVALHQACGFRVLGTREKLGRMHGRWRDVLLLERRSPVVR